MLVLAGATASGKTELSLELARRFDAEIVGADSRQIYRDMPIGTAMPSAQQQAEVPHHLIGFLDPGERYSAARYSAAAVRAIEAIQARDKRAIVCGGTGFYIRALLGGVSLAPQYDETVRHRLAAEARLHPPQFLHEWLSMYDARRAGELAPTDAYRVLRSLEIALTRPRASCAAQTEATSLQRTLLTEGIGYALTFLDVPLPQLDRQIDERAERMLASGFIEEAERVGCEAVAANAVGYPYAFAYLRGWSTRAELSQLLKRATRRYARRQRAWFRGERNALWLSRESIYAVVRERLGWLPK